MQNMKIVGVVPVKNDAWFIEKAAVSLSTWVDHVIIFDESSTDGSEQIYKRLDLIQNIEIVRERPKFDFTTPEMRNYMLKAARKFDGNNLIIEMHADEIMSAKILEPSIRNKLLEELKPGDALMLPWTTLWKDPILYRNDNSVWTNNNCWFGYVDDRVVEFTGPVFHGPRAPESFLKNKKVIPELEVIHYQFVNLSNERSKQALYQIFERNHYPERNVEWINKRYAVAFDERMLRVSKIAPEKIMPWVDRGIPLLEVYSDSDLNWRDLEVLKNFEKYGLDKYKNLNIWYINWNQKKQKLINQQLWDGNLAIVSDPRDFSTRLSHAWIMKTQLYPFWRFNFIVLVVEKILAKLKFKISFYK